MRNFYMKALALLLLIPALGGCSRMFASRTEASYIVRPDGSREVRYSSDKEQVGLEALVDAAGGVHVKVDKAGTQEQVIAAALQSQLMLGRILEALLPLLQSAATKTPPVPLKAP